MLEVCEGHIEDMDSQISLAVRSGVTTSQSATYTEILPG